MSYDNYGGWRSYPVIPYAVSVPLNLEKSLEGKYFVGHAEGLYFSPGHGAWARLYNPENSGVNLHVTVWTVTNLTDNPFLTQICFNADPHAQPQDSPFMTPANFALRPLPRPQIKLQYASDDSSEPSGGAQAYARLVGAQSTVADEEEGKFIFPPGGSFLVYLFDPEDSGQGIDASVAFGWYEEPLRR